MRSSRIDTWFAVLGVVIAVLLFVALLFFGAPDWEVSP